MKAKTEELLHMLFWIADHVTRPTFRNLTDSYEGWAYRNGLLRQMARLESSQLVENRATSTENRLYRLTEEGCRCALGGRDPRVQWSREWDGRWRMVLFDVPVSRDSHRKRLRRYLRERGFGCLQGSVWVTPDLLEEERRILRNAKVDVESLLLLDTTPCAGESDAEIVAGAWDFKRINERYLRLIRILDARPSGPLQTEAAAKAMFRWISSEREAWMDAVTQDPMLPQRILPPSYLGQKAWNRRVEVLRQAGAEMRSFIPT